jgi:hypothetical protein
MKMADSIDLSYYHDVAGAAAPPGESRYNTDVATMTGYDFDRYTDGKFDLDVARTSD